MKRPLHLMNVHPGLRGIYANAFRQSARATELSDLHGLSFLTLIYQEANITIVKSGSIQNRETFLFLLNHGAGCFNFVDSVAKGFVRFLSFPKLYIKIG